MCKCPFWSTKEEYISCYRECPMNLAEKKGDCPFKEHLNESRLKFKDIIVEDFAYASERYYDFDRVDSMSNY
ncbi:hypothetical protein [Clostridium sp.]|uniref:hypothetical protein n=1 Tax=Clostridium sp. TaxID=1506 RepID=UPI003F3B5652